MLRLKIELFRGVLLLEKAALPFSMGDNGAIGTPDMVFIFRWA